jgi:hypothetical protein
MRWVKRYPKRSSHLFGQQGSGWPFTAAACLWYDSHSAIDAVLQSLMPGGAYAIQTNLLADMRRYRGLADLAAPAPAAR